MRSDLTVDAVVVTYNGAPWIEQCLKSLQGQERLREVIVVDNASTDNTTELIRQHFPQVVLLPLVRNMGFGSGNNVGISYALQRGASHIYLLNQDAWAPPGSVKSLADFLDLETDFGVVSALHCSPDEATVDQKTLTCYLSLHARNYLADTITGRVKTHYRIHGVNAAAWMISAPTLERVGGFDPLFFMYGEDDDWLDRLAHHGIGFALLPHVKVVHLRQSPAPACPPDASALREKDVRWQVSRLLLGAKRPGYSRQAVLKHLVLRGAIDPLLDFAFDGQGRELLSRWSACARLLRRFGEVTLHARTTAQSGRHFLP